MANKKKRPPSGGQRQPNTTAQQQTVPIEAEEALVNATPGGVNNADSGADEVEVTVPAWRHALIAIEPEQPDERELKDLIKAWRRGRATKRIGQMLQDGYVTVFAVLMIVAILGNSVYRAQGAAAGCDSTTCTVGRTLLPWVAIGASFCLTLLASRIFGPVVASAAEGFWLMDAPIRRGRFLWSRLIGALAAVGFGMALVGALLAALTGYPWIQILEWAAAMGLGTAGLTAIAAAEQTYGRTWIMKTLQWIFGVVAFLALFTITGVAAGWFDLEGVSGTSPRIVLTVAAAGVIVLVVFTTVALRRLGYIHRARLVAGGNLVTGMQGAAFAMDIGLMRDILVERDMLTLGHVKPTYGRGSGPKALTWREVQRLIRFPKRALIVVVSIVVPYAVMALGLAAFAPLISALVLLVGFVPMLGTLRVATRTRGLARMFPFSNPQIRWALTTVPAIFAVIWALATLPAFAGLGTTEGFGSVPISRALAIAGVTAAGGLLAGIRWVTAKSADYSSPMLQTGFGAMPPSLLFNLFRGFDIAFLVTGPLLIGLSPTFSVIIAIICAFALSGRFGKDEMERAQAEAQKERDRMKSSGGSASPFSAAYSAGKKSTEKKVVTPPKRR
ncbi:MAG: DUF6297 family protein [Propionibacteriaceae bacterium]|jgi:hypothetical protein|nr:DUF6297 family protein [Propionibacteriaceae bacterium]